MRQALFFVFLSITAFSRNDSLSLKRISVGAIYSPDYCYRMLNYSTTSTWIKELRNTEETPMFGFSAGIGLKAKMTSQITLETGAYYTIRGEQTKKKALNWVSPDPAFPAYSKTKFKYTIIEFPLKIKYSLNTTRFSYAAMMGISANVFSEKNSKTMLEYENGHTTKVLSNVNIGYRKFNVAVCLGAELKYAFSEQVAFTLEPAYKQFMTSILIDEQSKEYLYSMGLAVGVYFTFKKKNKGK